MYTKSADVQVSYLKQHGVCLVMMPILSLIHIICELLTVQKCGNDIYVIVR